MQRNLVVKINKDVKRTYYSNVNLTEAGKEKTFWKTFKPLFSSTCTEERRHLSEHARS